MLRSYAARYSLIAVCVSLAFVALYTVLELNKAGRAITLVDFAASFDLKTALVLTAPVTFTTLAYLAGQQRDKVAAYAREREALNSVLRTLIHAPDPDLDQTLPRALQQIARAVGMDAAALLVIRP